MPTPSPRNDFHFVDAPLPRVVSIASGEHDVVHVPLAKNKSDTYASALGLYTETCAVTVSTLPPSRDTEYVDSSTLLATRLWKDGTMTTCSLQAGPRGFATYDLGGWVEECEVVTARDTDVRCRPAACVVAVAIDSDADVVFDALAVSEVPNVPAEPTAIDVVDKAALQLWSRLKQQWLDLEVGRRDQTQVFLLNQDERAVSQLTAGELVEGVVAGLKGSCR